MPGIDQYPVFHYIDGMAVKPMTGRAFSVLIALAGGPRQGTASSGGVAEVRAATARIVWARLGAPGMEAAAGWAA